MSVVCGTSGRDWKNVVLGDSVLDRRRLVLQMHRLGTSSVF